MNRNIALTEEEYKDSASIVITELNTVSVEMQELFVKMSNPDFPPISKEMLSYFNSRIVTAISHLENLGITSTF